MRVISSKTIKLLSTAVFSFSNHRNLYEVLEVKQGASFKEIKQKYLKKSKQYHPDVAKQAHNHYHHVQEAYKTLINPQKRKKYDLSLGIHNSQWEKQLISHKFNDSFQSAAFEEILKDNIKTNNFINETIQQKLHREFDTQIKTNKLRKIFISPSFMIGLTGIGLLWLIWNALQTILTHHQGNVEHNVEIMHTAQTVKVVPMFSR